MDVTRISSWTIPDDWIRISTIDAHTAGEPLRIILNGFPEVPRTDVLEVRRIVQQHHDLIRKLLMWEPRGHADMYGCVVTPPVTEGASFGIIFLHNEGYSTMCGHGVIAVVKVLLETQAVRSESPVTELSIDTPAGIVTARAHVSEGSVGTVSFKNVPSYVVDLDATVVVPGLGEVPYDLAFGGAFYAFVRSADVGLECTPDHYRELISAGMAIKRAIVAARTLTHPTDPDLAFLYGTIFTGRAEDGRAHSRNVCVFADGQVDRSPTGTGVSARAAIHHLRGEVGVGEWIEIESIIGSRFRVRVAETTTFASMDAVIPEVEGAAFITGRHEFVVDPKDPLRDGFLLR